MYGYVPSTVWYGTEIPLRNTAAAVFSCRASGIPPVVSTHSTRYCMNTRQQEEGHNRNGYGTFYVTSRSRHKNQNPALGFSTTGTEIPLKSSTCAQSGGELHGQILTSENEAPSNSRNHSQGGSEFDTPRTEYHTNFRCDAQEKAATRGGQRGRTAFLSHFSVCAPNESNPEQTRYLI